MGARLAAVAGALPERWMTQEAIWDERFSRHYGEDAAAKRVWLRCGVDRRHGVLDPIEEGVADWGTGRRMERFVKEALPLARQALETALERAAVAPAELDLLAVVSCTGYATPGLDILLARDLGLRDDVQRLHVGHMGCYAAVPGLGAVADAAAARGQTAALVCVELTTLHVQPAERSLEQIVAHALFADGAAAAIVRPEGAGLEVGGVAARTDVSTAALMTWDVTDHGFRMGLSPKVPEAVRRHVAPVVDELLERQGLTRADVTAWAIHPGGPAIVDAVGDALGLDDAALEPSRETLREVGNCSSATVLMVLERLGPVEGNVVGLAFGPGLTLYGFLLRSA